MHFSQQPSQWACQVETVTPERAADILHNQNTKNRRLRPGVVTQYAQLMKDGDWKLSPEAIVISASGRLLNGQHRLHAVITAGLPQQFFMIYGPPDDVFSVLDRGAKRSTADAMGLDKKLAEAATLLCVIQGGAHTAVNDFAVARAADFIHEGHKQLLQHCNSMRPLFSSAPFRLAAVARIMGGANSEHVHELYRQLVLAHTEDLPPIGHAAMRMFLQGGFTAHGAGNAGRVRTLCSAWAIFDPAKRNNSRFASPPRERCVIEISAATGYSA